MKGFVPTPPETVDLMVDRLFKERPPLPSDLVLDPGCGTGEFIDGILRWCGTRRLPLPQIIGVDSDPKHMPTLLAKFAGVSQVQIEHRDFLQPDCREFQYIVGNPPYVPITQLSGDEKERYRGAYSAARGRFDLYLLFFEQAIRNLAPNGQAILITPEKFLYVETAGPLRNLLSEIHVVEIRLADESTFGPLVTYPTITVLRRTHPGPTLFISRTGEHSVVRLPGGCAPWMPALCGPTEHHGEHILADYCSRISCGIATGADEIFVRPEELLTTGLRQFSRPTISGRELSLCDDLTPSRSVMLVPYDEGGTLLPEGALGDLGEYLSRPEVKARLLERTCVARKAWYAFHETPVLHEILRPKILCKDICERPCFVADYSGEILPRHSVYYLVPHDAALIPAMLDYLRSEAVVGWLESNAQRAAKGFLRMQSRTLQKLPVKADLFHLSTETQPRARVSKIDPSLQPQLALRL